jgi:hypothetical protein
MKLPMPLRRPFEPAEDDDGDDDNALWAAALFDTHLRNDDWNLSARWKWENWFLTELPVREATADTRERSAMDGLPQLDVE